VRSVNGATPRNARLRFADPPRAMTRKNRFRRAHAAPAPPDPHTAWDAEVRWVQDDRSGHFRAEAAPIEGGPAVELVSSEPIAWPPSAEGAQALSAAVQQIEDALVDAGWQSLPGGDAWYARRFTWDPVPLPAEPVEPPGEPVVTIAPAPAERQTPRAPAPGPARSRTGSPRAAVPRAAVPRTAAEPAPKAQDWPDDTGALWRCEIRWHGGWRTSRFEALAVPPGKKRGPRVAASPEIKWMLMGDPDPKLPSVRTALVELRAALRTAGWEPAGRGRHWYALRFAWRGEGPPPDVQQPKEQGV
jgi:hypothetical protein